MKSGSVRKVFPGGNTGLGFHSFFEYITRDRERVYIVKGGPGVGKSTFFRRLGQDLVSAGLDVDFLCCASDNNSLDGILVHSKNVAFIDGTAPQSAEPTHKKTGSTCCVCSPGLPEHLAFQAPSLPALSPVSLGTGRACSLALLHRRNSTALSQVLLRECNHSPDHVSTNSTVKP